MLKGEKGLCFTRPLNVAPHLSEAKMPDQALQARCSPGVRPSDCCIEPFRENPGGTSRSPASETAGDENQSDHSPHCGQAALAQVEVE